MLRTSPFSAFLVTAVLVAIAGCGPSAPSSGSHLGGGAARTGPATASLNLTGDSALAALTAGPVAGLAVACAVPGLDGESITVSGNPTAQPDLYVFITVRSAQLLVSLRSGQAATYRERDFTGTGVSGFDPATGARLSGSLSDTTPADTNKGTLGLVSSISGTVRCGGQTPGSTTIRVTGTEPAGALGGALTSARVACTTSQYGVGVSLQALTTVGGAPAFVLVTFTKYNGSQAVANVRPVTVFVVQKAATPRYYNGPGTFSVTSKGGHVVSDVVEQTQGGASPSTLHVVGDATCGSNP